MIRLIMLAVIAGGVLAGGTVGDPDASLYKEQMDPYWSLQARVPAAAIPTLDSDGMLAVWQPNGWVLEIHSGIVLTNGDIVANYVSYTQPDGLGDGCASGRRASMIPNYAGVIRSGELTAQDIPHALSIGLGQTALDPSYVPPALAFDRNTTGYAGSLPMGTLFAIPPGVDLGSLGLASNDGLSLATAAQTYGIYVTDVTGTTEFVIFGDSEGTDIPGWNGPLAADLEILIDELEVVTGNPAPAGNDPITPTYLNPFSENSLWNNPIDGSASYSGTNPVAAYSPGLSTFGWAAGGPAIWQATGGDPLITLYFHVDGYANAADSTWARYDNSSAIEDDIRAGYDQLWAGAPANFYSTQVEGDFVLPTPGLCP